MKDNACKQHNKAIKKLNIQIYGTARLVPDKGSSIFNIDTGEFIQSMKLQDCKCALTKTSNVRSLKQNAYYWSVIIPTIIQFLTETQGWVGDSNSAHIMFKVLAGWGKMVEKEVIIGDNIIKMSAYNGESMSNIGNISVENFMEGVDKVESILIHAWTGFNGFPKPDNRYEPYN